MTPRTAATRRATRFRFVVSAIERGMPVRVAGATVRFAGLRVRTGADGRAQLIRRIAHPRKLGANTTAPGYEAGRASVRVRARR